jgi:transposase
MEITTFGIDIGKSVLHLVGFDQRGHVVMRKRLSRDRLLKLIANRPRCLIGMEACCGAHHLGRALAAQGHDVRLMPAQYVRPFLKGNKNDYLDAEAIAEAVQRPTMRFVSIKTVEQLDLQAMHRVRDRLVSRRTAVINQIRAFLLERGVTLPAGRRRLAQRMWWILDDAENGVSDRMRNLLRGLWEEWRRLESDIDAADREIVAVARQNDACRRLAEIPGVGPMIATALVAAVGDGSAFTKGRDLAAWLGLVPRQHSTGGRQRLLGISKRGNTYLRRLFVHGARAIFARLDRDRNYLGQWVNALEARRHPNVAVIALANKLARTAWAVLHKRERYRSPGAALGMTSANPGI